MQPGFYDAYEKASNWLRLISRSEIRIKMLMTLNGGPKDLSQLREQLSLSSSTIIHAIGDMGSEGIIERSPEQGYTLTNIGSVQAVLVNDLINVLGVLSRNREFWLTHDISGIPNHLLKRIGDLGDCEVVKSSPDDVFKIFSNYFQLVGKAKVLKGVSPIFYPDFPGLVKALVDKKSKVELVLTKEVFFKVMEMNQDRLKALNGFLSEGVLELWVIDGDIKVALTVTDSALSFGLFNCEGTYDVLTDLVSYGDKALNWGRELFEYYRIPSKKITPEEMK